MHLKQSQDLSPTRRFQRSAFHVSCGLLEKKIYSTENNRITIGYKMLLCRGLVLLTAVNSQSRFRLVNRVGLHAFCPCGSCVPMCIWIQAVLFV